MGLPEKVLLSFPISGLPGAGSLPPWLSPWSPAGIGWRMEFSHPQGRPLGSAAVPSASPRVLQFWGRGFSPSSISEVPGAPLYKTASPVRSQLQRGCFCGGSRQGLLNVFPSQIQTFSAVPGNRPSFPTLAASWSQGCMGGRGERGCRATSSHKPLPQASRPRPHRCPHSRPGTLSPSTPPS